MNEQKNKQKEQVSAVSVQVERFPTIKRMLANLDKFLNKRIAGIAILYVCAAFLCSTFIIIGGVTASASDGNGWSTTQNIVLYSLVGVMTLIFLVVVARVIVMRRRRGEKNEQAL